MCGPPGSLHWNRAQAYTLVHVAGLLPAAAHTPGDVIVVTSVHAFLRTRSRLGWLLSILTACAQASIVVMVLSARQTAEHVVVPEPPPPPYPPPPPPMPGIPPLPPGMCGSSCSYNNVSLAFNGVCDDGGEGAEFSRCSVGTDCDEYAELDSNYRLRPFRSRLIDGALLPRRSCGIRSYSPPPLPPPPPTPPAPPTPLALPTLPPNM